MYAVIDKNIWITGASSGMGKMLATQLARRGNTVFISGRHKQRLEEMSHSIPGLVAVPCDVTDEQSVKDAIGLIKSHVDSLDVVVLNAGTCEYVDDAELSLPMFERVFAVNFFAAIRCLSVVMPLLKSAQRRGLLVGISSLSTVVGFPRAEAYGASKAAFQYLMDSLRLDLREHKIDVLVVQPGFVKTPMTESNDFPMPFMKDVEYATDKIIEAMDRRKTHLAFPWQLNSILRFAGCFKNLWYRWVGPKLVRQNRL